jgi:hypothetical protein
MKKQLCKYVLYVYVNFIQEDLTIFKEWGIPIIKTLNFIYSIIIWGSAIILFPIFIIGMKTNNLEFLWKEIEKIEKTIK